MTIGEKIKPGFELASIFYYNRIMYQAKHIKVRNYTRIRNFGVLLTLLEVGLEIYIKWHPLLNTQNHCEKTFFAFQIGHIEIVKVTKFGLIWRPFWWSLG